MADERLNVVQGGLQAQNATTTGNFNGLLGFPFQQPAEFSFSLSCFPSIVCAVRQPSSTTWELDAISAQRASDGQLALRVNTMGAPITWSAAAADNNVGVASTSILAANSLRRAAVISNVSAGTIYIRLAFGAAADAAKGIYLPAGASYEMNEALGNLTTQEIRAIGSAAGATVAVQEGV